jgi:hypothetical protein
MHGYGYIDYYKIYFIFKYIENIIIHKQDKVMRVTGIIQKCKAKVYFNYQMDVNMKVSTLMIKKMVMEYFHGVLNFLFIYFN